MNSINEPLFDEDPTLPPAPAADFGNPQPPTPSLPETGAGLEELGPRDLRIPQLKIRQPLTLGADGVPEGSFFVTADPAFHSIGRDLVVLEVRKERSLMLPYGGGAAAEAVVERIAQRTGVEIPSDWEGPVCFSHDRIKPVELEGLPVLSDTCADCPMNRWRTVTPLPVGPRDVCRSVGPRRRRAEHARESRCGLHEGPRPGARRWSGP